MDFMGLKCGSGGCNNRTEYLRLHEGPCEKGLGSDGCNNRTEYVRLHEGPYEKGIGV